MSSGWQVMLLTGAAGASSKSCTVVVVWPAIPSTGHGAPCTPDAICSTPGSAYGSRLYSPVTITSK